MHTEAALTQAGGGGSIHGMQHALQALPPSPAAADPESFFATLEILAAPGKGQRRVPKSEPLQVGRAEGRW